MIAETYSENETFELGRAFGESLAPGDIVCLYGDLGTGKTVFARGIASALGVGSPVKSPTFTLLRQYEGDGIGLNHFDVYRIADPSELEAIGYEEYFYSDDICIVEWAELIEDLLPQEAIRVFFCTDLTKGADYRKIVSGIGEECVS